MPPPPPALAARITPDGEPADFDTDSPGPPSAIPAPVARARLPSPQRYRTRFRTKARHRFAKSWWRAAPRNLRGSICMMVAFVFFATMMAGIKAIGSRLPLVEILTIRQLVIVTMLLPLFVRAGSGLFRTSHLGLQIQRGLFGLGAMLTTFTAMMHIPLAETTAIGFSQSLFVTIGAVVFLGETVGWRHWSAIIAGFVGVLVMLKPAGENINLYGLLVLLGALLGAALTITVRRLAESERTETILAYQAVILLAALGIPTLLWWTPPTVNEWLLLLMIGSAGAVAQWLMTKAYQIGDAAALAPLDFFRLITMTIVGYMIFSERLTSTTVIGSAIVVAAVIFIVQHNSRRATQARNDPAAPT
jgi:drug/metabolite transporter (DMT)-like permease